MREIGRGPSDVEPVNVLRDIGSIKKATRDQIVRYFALSLRGEKFEDAYIANEFEAA